MRNKDMVINSSSRIGFDPVSILVDKKRWFPMMGEMHFSRYPRKYWAEELAKMKSGGIDIVSLYVIWIHHEEIQGEFDFTGDRDLRAFLETVRESGLKSILRIGPWAHGEARNGGFPDWLLEDAKEKGYEVRSDAPEYLEHAKKFYEKIYEQAKGFFLSDDGPIIGVQIENEYGHCGGKNGPEGEQHMKTLLGMAKEIGFNVPIYTATGWGGAVTGGMLPVMGGYCEAPWDPRTTEIEPSGNYIFTRERNDHNIGSDHGIGAGITFDMDKFPYLTAELGGGLQVTKHRRPIATGADTGAMSMVKLGSGANLLGYYMYHGGTNPKGKLTTLQETKETGYPNDLPAYSYDFNAPIREFGQMEDAYREVRLLGTFIHDFGSDLCDMKYTDQPGNPAKPDNLTDIRTAVRHKGGSGYLFVNNYQRRNVMACHKDAELSAYDEEGKVLATFPKRDIEDKDFFFYPFNLPVGDKAQITIDATPLCILEGAGKNGKDAYVFYTDSDRQATADVKGDLDGNVIITLTRSEALHSAKVVIGEKQHLVISEGEAVTSADGEVYLYSLVSDEAGSKKISFRAFPELEKVPGEFDLKKKGGSAADFSNGDIFAIYESQKTISNDLKAECNKISDTEYELTLPGNTEGASEVFACIDYEGNSAVLEKDGEVMTDNFYTGQDFEIGLKRYWNGEKTLKCKLLIEPLF